MSLDNKSNICTICKKKGKTDWHNITSYNHGFSNPNNRIELCSNCQSKAGGQGQSSERKGVNDGGVPAKQKSREARVLAKQKSREGKVRSQKRNLERKDKQERITSRKKSP